MSTASGQRLRGVQEKLTSVQSERIRDEKREPGEATTPGSLKRREIRWNEGNPPYPPVMPVLARGGHRLRVGADAVLGDVQASLFLGVGNPDAHGHLEGQEHDEAGAEGPGQHHAHAD